MNQRRQGHKWERDVVKWIKQIIGYTDKEIGTTRQHSRALDAKKVDIWVDDADFPFYIQCKKTTTKAKSTRNVDVLSLEQMPKDKMRLLFTKVCETVDKRQKTLGKYVTMELDEFRELFKLYCEHNDDATI